MIDRNSHVRLRSGAEVGVVAFMTKGVRGRCGYAINPPAGDADGAMVDWPRSGRDWHPLVDLVELASIADLGMGGDG